MKKIALYLIFIFSIRATAQTDSLRAIEEINEFQKELNEEYKDRKTSPLGLDVIGKFEGHEFFPINLKYRVLAKLTITEGTPFFGMKTTTSRLATERVYGHVSFVLEGKEFKLPVYQSKDLMQQAAYADYLFFPFTDETNGNESYGGGRYIDLRIPKESNELVIDFNKAYNPYCAYSSRYSCPVVPAENQMNIEVPVGVKYQQKLKSETVGPAIPELEPLSPVDVQPEFPGGYTGLAKFIRKNMRYPKAAIKKKIQGTVYVQFIVKPDGSISDVTTIRGIFPECDQEAERVVSLMPKWKPGQFEGKNVPVRFVQPIAFVGRPGWNKR